MGVGTVTYSDITFTSVKKSVISWTTMASTGSASASTETFLDGQLLSVTTIPDGTDKPDINYDIYLKDSNGFDHFLGYGRNRSSANTETFTPTANAATGSSYGIAVLGHLTFAVTNAGNSKKGKCILFWR